MVFRIANLLTDEDYKIIAESLSDKKRLEDGGSMFAHHHIDDEDRISMRILKSSELEIPLARIGERYRDGQVNSSDAENYGIEIEIEYDSRENGFSGAVEILKDSIPAGFTSNSGKKTIEYFKEGRGYRASCIGREIKITTIRERKIETEMLKTDIMAILLITELVVNAVYEAEKSGIELEIRVDINRNRILTGRNRRSRLDKAIVLEKPTLSFQDIGGCEEAKAELTLLGHGLMKPESFEKWGISYPKGILLHGLPGTGKTLLAKAMANLAQASLFCVSVTDVISSFYGQSPRLIAKVFETAQRNAPSIILFDEIDSLARNREDSHEETVRVVSVFLQKMDGIKGMDKVTVIGTTNSVESIDRAMLRPGRFDKIIEVPLPDKAARSDIFKLHCKGKRIGDAVDYMAMAGKSDQFTGADIKEVVQMGLGKRLREELNTGNANLPPLDTEDILASISEYRKRKDLRILGGDHSENAAMYA